MAMGPREGRVLHAMSIDDAYEVQQVLASGPGGRTEVVTIDGLGPYLRKKIPLSLVDRRVWACLSECTSPRLPHVVATYETPDEFVAVCDFVPADTISEIIAAEKRLSVLEAVRATLEVCEAVEELHRHGIVHCDISPRNVLLAADGAHVIDLGIARPTGTEPSSEGPNLGTHGFAAPEQYGFAPIDERSDIYAIARLLGFMLTGLEPSDAYREALADESIVPAPLRAVIECGSAFEPSARFQTIQDFAGAVAEGSRGAFPQGATRGSEPCRATAEARNAAGSESDEGLSGAAVSPVGRARAKKRRAAFVAALCICAVLVVLGAVGFSIASDAMGKVAARSGAVFADRAADGQVRDSDVLSADGKTQEAVDSSSLGSVPSTGSSENKATFRKEDLVVAESAWRMSGGYISYVFALRNESEDAVVDFPAVSIVGRDSEGKVVSSDEQALSVLYPGETMFFASIAGTGTVTPRSVDFLPLAPDEYQVYSAQSEGATFRVTDVSATTDAFGGTVFVGEVAWEGGEKPESAASDVIVVVVLRDDKGNLVGGTTTFVNCSERGVPVAFETLGEDVPDYASIEAYAYAW